MMAEKKFQNIDTWVMVRSTIQSPNLAAMIPERKTETDVYDETSQFSWRSLDSAG